VYICLKKQGDDVQLKKEGEKKKAKSTVTWHEIKCDGFVKKSYSNVPVYKFFRLRRSGRTCYFGPKPKSSAPGTVVDNPVNLCDEEDD